MSDAVHLTRLLEEERLAILSGTFLELSRITAVKERLLEGLTRTRVPLSDLRRIAAEVSRNQSLLSAAIDGVKSVGDRMAELRRTSDGFETYGPAGDRSKVGAGRPRFERKA